MTVYVDPLFRVGNKGYFCHMIADTKQELEDFERLIGVHYIHSSSSRIRNGCHTINERERARALGNGAVETTQEQLMARKSKTEAKSFAELAAEKKARLKAFETYGRERLNVMSIKML